MPFLHAGLHRDVHIDGDAPMSTHIGFSMSCILYAMWDVGRALADGLPPWHVVPPILLAIAAVYNARANFARAKSVKK